MNFLELCRKVYLEGGISGQITSVANQTGEAARVINWVANAYQEILNDMAINLNPTRRTSIVQLTAGKQSYSFSDLGLSSSVQWNTRAMRVAVNSDMRDETFLVHMRYPEFRDYWLFSARRSTTSRPLNACVDPDNNLLIAPIPAENYWLSLESQIQADKLLEDGDVPIFPERFHYIIVWRALRHYGLYEAAPEVVARADNAYHTLKLQLDMDQSFEAVVGEPIC